MIVNRVIEAIKKIQKNDFENALIQISIGIDSVAGFKYPNIKTTERCVKIIEEYRDFIYRFSTLGSVSVTGNINYSGAFEDKNLGEILYKVIRCGLLHGGKLPEDKNFIFTNGSGIGSFKFSDNITEFGFIISTGLLLSLCLIIIENDNSEDYKKLVGYTEFRYSHITLKIDKSLWTDNNLTNNILNEFNI